MSSVTGKVITHQNTNIPLHGQTDLSLARATLKYHNFSADACENFVKEFLTVHPTFLEESCRNGIKSEACPHITEVLDMVGEKKKNGDGISVGLLTGNSQAGALVKIKAAGLPVEVFDMEISSFGDKYQSRTELFHNSARKIEAKVGGPLRVTDVMLVGDTPLDILSAKEVGCKIIAVATGSYEVNVLAQYQPQYVVTELGDAKAIICA